MCFSLADLTLWHQLDILTLHLLYNWKRQDFYIEVGNIGWAGVREVLLTSLGSLETASVLFLQVHPLLVVVFVEICPRHPFQSNLLIWREKVHNLTQVSFPGPPN